MLYCRHISNIIMEESNMKKYRNTVIIALSMLAVLVSWSCKDVEEDDEFHKQNQGGVCRECVKYIKDGKEIPINQAEITIPAGVTEYILECKAYYYPIAEVNSYFLGEPGNYFNAHTYIKTELVDTADCVPNNIYVMEPCDSAKVHGKKVGVYRQRIRITAPDSTETQYAVVSMREWYDHFSCLFNIVKETSPAP